MYAMRVSTRALARRISAEIGALRTARHAALRAVGSAAADYAARNAPRDTGRFKRGWLAAAAAAGVYAGPLPAIRRSRYLARYVETIRAWADRQENLARTLQARIRTLYPDGPPRRARTTYYQTLTRQLDAARRRAQKAYADLAELERHRHAIVIGGLFVPGGRGGAGPRVRTTIYGGSGTLRDLGETTVLRLHNREPHTTLVERRVALVAGMNAAARAVGATRVRPAFIRAINQRRRLAAP